MSEIFDEQRLTQTTMIKDEPVERGVEEPTAVALPERLRLRSAQRIREVLARGRRVAGGVGSLHVLPRSSETSETRVSEAQQGAGRPLSSRWCVICSRRVGGAVVRNRLRRRSQAVFMALEPQLCGSWDVVYRARPAAAALGYVALRAELTTLMQRARVLASGAEQQRQPRHQARASAVIAPVGPPIRQAEEGPNGGPASSGDGVEGTSGG